MRGRIKNLMLTLAGKQELTLEVDDARAIYDELNGKDLDIELKIHREKRSLDANAYAWVLIGKLADKTRQAPDDIYREAVRDVGGNYVVLPIRADALEAWKRIWNAGKIGRMVDDLGESKLPGYVNTRNFYGSSEFDRVQMSRLIDLLIEEAKEQGIETKTPEELERLKSLWNP